VPVSRGSIGRDTHVVRDTFAAIRPADAPAFIIPQLLGASAATLLFRWLTRALPHVAHDIIVPHLERTS